MSQAPINDADLQERLFVARAGGLGGFLFDALQLLDVGKHQFHFDNFDVGKWIDIATYVDYVGIFETTDHLHDRINLTNVAEKLVAQPFAHTSAFDNAGNVNQFQDGRDDFLRFDVLGDSFEAVVGDADDPLVRFDRAKRIVRARCCLRTGQCVEQRAFAYIGQSDNSGFHRLCDFREIISRVGILNAANRKFECESPRFSPKLQRPAEVEHCKD